MFGVVRLLQPRVLGAESQRLSQSTQLERTRQREERLPLSRGERGQVGVNLHRLDMCASDLQQARDRLGWVAISYKTLAENLSSLCGSSGEEGDLENMSWPQRRCTYHHFNSDSLNISACESPSDGFPSEICGMGNPFEW